MRKLHLFFFYIKSNECFRKVKDVMLIFLQLSVICEENFLMVFVCVLICICSKVCWDSKYLAGN